MGAQGECEACSTAEVRVSVICTARNAEGTLARTIQSMLQQDIADWEMIVVDDGSTDRTLDIARAFAASDRRIRCSRVPSATRDRSSSAACTARRERQPSASPAAAARLTASLLPFQRSGSLRPRSASDGVS